jgi:hypothetical protein
MIDSELQEQRIRRTLRAVAERTVVAPGLEEPWLGGPLPSPHRPGRILVGVAAAIVIAAAVSLTVVYGPRSSNVGGSMTGSTLNPATAPQVSLSWAVPMPKGLGFVSESQHLFRAISGIEKLKDAPSGGPIGNATVLRRDGWKSGIAEAWEPEAVEGLLQTPNPGPVVTIGLSIDQFDSSAHAADYRSTAESLLKQAAPHGAHLKLVTFRALPGALVERFPVALLPSQSGFDETAVVITFHRGPYVVELSAEASTNAVPTAQYLVENLAQDQYRRLPH